MNEISYNDKTKSMRMSCALTDARKSLIIVLDLQVWMWVEIKSVRSRFCPGVGGGCAAMSVSSCRCIGGKESH